jgi:hypothetical protein
MHIKHLNFSYLTYYTVYVTLGTVPVTAMASPREISEKTVEDRQNPGSTTVPVL